MTVADLIVLLQRADPNIDVRVSIGGHPEVKADAAFISCYWIKPDDGGTPSAFVIAAEKATPPRRP